MNFYYQLRKYKRIHQHHNSVHFPLKRPLKFSLNLNNTKPTTLSASITLTSIFFRRKLEINVLIS